MYQGNTYHPHIDGLRAIAVIPVIAFHLGLGPTGGFAGVDLFFVISGFLITSIILRQVAAGTFALGKFFNRRIARIAPASFFMLSVVLIVGRWILLPNEFRELAQATIAQVCFAGNIYHFRETGYFDPGGHLRPLLHTWSLAIEEQFYLVFPATAILLHRRGHRTTTVALATLLVVSLLIGIRFTFNEPRAGYFLFQCRAWELLCGCLLATVIPRFRLGRKLAEVVSWTGLSIVALSYILLTQDSAFPGFWAILPCAGACLLISSDLFHRTVVGKCLSLTPVVWTGKISYSLYLWHWPVIVYFRHLLLDIHNPIVLLSVVATTFVMALFSYTLVEKPLRAFLAGRGRTLCLPGFGLSAAVLIAGACFVWQKDGIPERFSPKIVSMLGETRRPGTTPLSPEAIAQGEVHRIHVARSADRPRVLVYGDSHAEMYFPAFAELGELYDHNVEALYARGTIPLPDCWSPNSPTGDIRSLLFKQTAIEQFTKNPPDVLVVAARWDAYTRTDPLTGLMIRAITDADSVELSIPDSKRVFDRRLVKFLETCANLPSRVFFILPAPAPDFDVPSAVARASLGFVDVQSKLKNRQTILTEQGFCRGIFNKKIPKNFTILDPLKNLLDENGAIVVLGNGGELVFRDSHHLSAFGAKTLSPILEQVFQTAE